MSAAFALDFSGPPVPCDFPGCTLDAFHEGEHVLPQPKPVPAGPVYTCIVCKVQFVVYGQTFPGERILCGDSQCGELYARALARLAGPLPVSCRCPQREYPHDLSVHAEVRAESRNPRLKNIWPWALCQSVREELSTERRAGQ